MRTFYKAEKSPRFAKKKKKSVKQWLEPLKNLKIIKGVPVALRKEFPQLLLGNNSIPGWVSIIKSRGRVLSQPILTFEMEFIKGQTWARFASSRLGNAWRICDRSWGEQGLRRGGASIGYNTVISTYQFSSKWIDLCCLENNYNSRSSPATTWMLATQVPLPLCCDLSQRAPVKFLLLLFSH